VMELNYTRRDPPDADIIALPDGMWIDRYCATVKISEDVCVEITHDQCSPQCYEVNNNRRLRILVTHEDQKRLIGSVGFGNPRAIYFFGGGPLAVYFTGDFTEYQLAGRYHQGETTLVNLRWISAIGAALTFFSALVTAVVFEGWTMDNMEEKLVAYLQNYAAGDK